MNVKVKVNEQNIALAQENCGSFKTFNPVFVKIFSAHSFPETITIGIFNIQLLNTGSSRVINLLLTRLSRAVLGKYLPCQDLGPIFSQYGPRAWSIRYIYSL